MIAVFMMIEDDDKNYDNDIDAAAIIDEDEKDGNEFMALIVRQLKIANNHFYLW